MKGATYLDVVAKADILAFDKTGTLTNGNFTVRSTKPVNGVTEEELFHIAAAVEKGSAHPISKAFENISTTYRAEEIAERSGLGLTATIDGERVLVGNPSLLKEEGISFKEESGAFTLVHVARGSKYLGVIELGDTLRAGAGEVLAELKRAGISSVMLTGDNVARAKLVADELQISEAKAGLLPDDKLKAAEQLKEKGTLLYVGDGINDAPVMTAADCALSMGKLGSAAAVEASDLVLVSDDLRAIPKALRIAKKTRSVVVQNILFSIAMKVAFMALGAIGVLPLWLAVFADVGVMLLAVLNSFRVRK